MPGKVVRMKIRTLAAVFAALAVLSGGGLVARLSAQEGPQSSSSDSVAKPKPKDNTPPPADEAPIPSEYKKPKADLPPADSPTFKATATTVTVDVSVLDDKNRFIPQLSQDKFRVFEAVVQQQIVQFGKREATL